MTSNFNCPPSGVVVRRSNRPDPSVLAGAQIKDTRTLTGKLLGDPLSGRSAWDCRRTAIRAAEKAATTWPWGE